MTSVDDRIVNMQFDNATFERKLSETIASLDRLTESLKFSGAEKGFTNISAAANSLDFANMTSGIDGAANGLGAIATAADTVDFSNMEEGIDTISSKFTALGVVAFTAIQNITNSVLDFAKSTATEDILGPIITGGKKRAVNIEQAKFMFRGLGIDVEAGMDSALKAVLGTAFGLDEAAKAAAQFGASGIKVGEEMTGALRGVAGAAAMTGSSFTEMADIFAGSAGSGFVNNQDLLQFATRGLNAAAAIAPILGTTEAGVHELATNGELDFKRFASAMDEAFGEHATKANETYTGSLANLHAAMSRLGASFFGRRLEQERDLFNALTPVIDQITKALKPLIDTLLFFSRISVDKIIGILNNLDLTNFKLGMSNISEGVANILSNFQGFSKTIREAFKAIFPPESGVSTLLHLTEAFKNLTEKLIMGADTVAYVRHIFGAIFSVLSIGMTIIKEVASLFGDLFSAIIGPSGMGDGKILKFFSDISGHIIDLKKNLVDGGGIHEFFINLRNSIEPTIEFIIKLKEKIVDFFDSFKAPSVSVTGNFDAISGSLDTVKEKVDGLSNVWDRFNDRMAKVFEVLAGVLALIVNWFRELGGKIADAFKPGDFDATVDLINTGLLGGLVIMLKKFLDGGFADFGTGLVAKIHGILDGITGSLQAMQTNLKAEALEKIALALLALTASVVILSMIDSAALAKALSAMTIGFAELVATMTAMDKLVGSTGAAAKLSILGVALMEIAIAMDLLSLAIANLSRLDWNELTKGLIGVGVGLAMLVLSTRLITADTAGLMSAGLAMIAISAGLLLLSLAVKAFSTMSWEEMAKGLVGVGVGLGVIVLAMKFMPVASTMAAGLALIPLAFGLTILAGAVKLFSTMSWEEMGQGLIGITGALVGIALAMKLMPLSLPITAAGILILSVALNAIALAVRSMGSMDLDTLVKGIGAFAAILLILTLAVNGMDTSLPGAAALVIIAGAMDILANVLIKLGAMSWQEILLGLASLAGVLLLLGGMSLLLSPLIPEMIGLGIAVGILGAGFALMGAAVYLVAKGLEILASSGVAGIKTLVTAIPEIVQALAASLINLAKDLLNAIPLLVRLLEALLDQLLDTIIKLTPKIAKAIVTIITEGLKLLREKFPDLVETGFKLLMAFLQGIRDNIGEITKVVADIIIKFIDSLTDKVPDFVESVYNFILTVLVELARKLGESTTAFIPIGIAFIDGILEGINEAVGALYTFFMELPIKILDGIKAALGIDSPSSKFAEVGVNIIAGLLQGLVEKVVDITIWFGELPGKIFEWLGDIVGKFVPKGWDFIIGLLQGLGEKELEIMAWFIGLPGKILEWIGDVATKLRDKGVELIGGLFSGILGGFKEIISWCTGLGTEVLRLLGDLGGTLVEIGKEIMRGLWNGMKTVWDEITGWLSNIDPRKAFGDTMGNIIGDAKTSMEKKAREAGAATGNATVEGFKESTESHSPSKVFMRLGAGLAEGLALGFGSEKVVSQFQNFARKVLESLSDMDEFNPTITPVLDLTKVQSESGKLERLMRLSPITSEVSFEHARALSIASVADQSTSQPQVNNDPSNVTFEQNIYAPTALTTNDIYRNTKSQIALAKEELHIS